MKQGWSVRIEGRPDRPLTSEEVLERLLSHHPAVTGASSELFSATVTVDATSALEAIEMAQKLLIAAMKPARLDIEDVEAMTEARLDAELERSNLPDLVGIAEMAEMAGTSRQRAFQMTANRGFPVALLELASGRLWSRAAVQGYLERRPRPRSVEIVGPPIPRGRVMGRRTAVST